MLSTNFIRLVIIAILIASPLAWLAMQKWLEGFAYRANVQWWIFIVAGLGAVLIAIITTSMQFIKAAMANPVKTLKQE